MPRKSTELKRQNPFIFSEEVPPSMHMENYRPRGSWQESLGAAIKLSHEDSTIPSLMRIYEHEHAEDEGPKLSVEKLRQIDPNIPWEGPLNRVQANIIKQRHERRRKLQAKIARGPQNNLQMGINFLGGMLPHMVDPVGVALGLATGGAFNAVKLGGTAAKVFGVSAEAASGMQMVSRNFAEGLVGNALLEPVPYVSNDQDLIEYTASQAATNVVAGALFFPAIHAGGLAISKPIRKAMEMRRLFDPSNINISQLPVAQQRALLSYQLEEVLKGRQPNNKAFLEKVELYNSGAFREIPYKHQRLDFDVAAERITNLEGHSFYVVADFAGDEIRLGAGPGAGRSRRGQTGRYTGPVTESIMAFDDKGIAYANAAPPFESSKRTVIEVQLNGNARVLSYRHPIGNRTLAENIADAFRNVEGFKRELRVGGLVRDFTDRLQKMNIAEIIRRIDKHSKSPEAFKDNMDRLHTALKLSGYDGYHTTGRRPVKHPRGPYNQFVLLNEAAIKKTINSFVPERTRLTLESEGSQPVKSDQPLFDDGEGPNSVKNFEEEFKTAPPERTEADYRTDYEKTIETLERMEEGGVHPSVKQEFEEIKKTQGRVEALAEYTDEIFECLVTNG